MPHSPRGHFMRARAHRTPGQAPSTVKYRKEPPAPVKCNFSNERLQVLRRHRGASGTV